MSDVDLQKLAEQVQWLTDLEEIKRLRAAYSRCMETHAWEEFEQLFTEDFRCRYAGGTYVFEADSREQFMAIMKQAFGGPAHSSHHVHTPEIDKVDDDHAVGTWYLQDFVDQGGVKLLYGTAIYRDEYVRTEQGWRISSSEYDRVVEMVFPFPDGFPYTARATAD